MKVWAGRTKHITATVLNTSMYKDSWREGRLKSSKEVEIGWIHLKEEASYNWAAPGQIGLWEWQVWKPTSITSAFCLCHLFPRTFQESTVWDLRGSLDDYSQISFEQWKLWMCIRTRHAFIWLWITIQLSDARDNPTISFPMYFMVPKQFHPLEGMTIACITCSSV